MGGLWPDRLIAKTNVRAATGRILQKGGVSTMKPVSSLSPSDQANFTKRIHPAFDYTVSFSRRNRYLVAECPELGFQVSGGALRLDQLDAAAIGQVVLRVYERIHARIAHAQAAGESLPCPDSAARRRGGRIDFLRSREASRALGVSSSTLKRMVREGEIEAHRTQGGHIRISLHAISEYLARKQERHGESRVDARVLTTPGSAVA
jgi:excisionase family DNA binding protein